MDTIECNENVGDRSCLIEKVKKTSHSIPMLIALYGQLFLLFALTAGGFVVPEFFKNQLEKTIDAFSAVNFYDIIIWIPVTILTWYVKSQHKKIQLRGYYNFHEKTKQFHKILFYIMCIGSALLLVVSSVTHNYCDGGATSPCSKKITLTPVNYQQIILFLKFICGLPPLIKHIVKVTQFNKSKAPPDVFGEDSTFQINKEELLRARIPREVEMFLQRQADQLEMLKNQNYLCKQIQLQNGPSIAGALSE